MTSHDTLLRQSSGVALEKVRLRASLHTGRRERRTERKEKESERKKEAISGFLLLRAILGEALLYTGVDGIRHHGNGVVLKPSKWRADVSTAKTKKSISPSSFPRLTRGR